MWVIIAPDWLPGFWSNEDGWVTTLSEADTFSDLEKVEYKLPMYGSWKELEND